MAKKLIFTCPLRGLQILFHLNKTGKKRITIKLQLSCTYISVVGTKDSIHYPLEVCFIM